MPDFPGERSDAVQVYWRPGCFFCSHLLRGLKRHDVTVELHNIWEDDDARSFVREHNRGNETVPTVALGGRVWTNPDTRTVVEAARSWAQRSQRETAGPSSAEAGASSAAPSDQ